MAKLRAVVALGVGVVTALALATTAGANHLLQGWGHSVDEGAAESFLTCSWPLNDGTSCFRVDHNGGSAFATAIRVNNNGFGSGVDATAGAGDGVRGKAFGLGSSGVFGENTSGGVGVAGQSGGTTQGGANFGVAGTIIFAAPLPAAAGVRAQNLGTNPNGYGLWASHAGSGTAAFAESPGGRGVYGLHSGAAGTTPGVQGETNSATDLAPGVYGASPVGTLGIGVYGNAANGIGVAGVGGNIAVVGYHPTGGLAGLFSGNVAVTGTLTKGAGAFRIDHPLDPAHRYLQHSFVESPDMKNVYDGVARTDRRGFATVRLPAYFSALNRSFRYQLTLLGKAAWGAQAVVWQEIRSNRFVVRSKPHVKVSWQVTGIRKDRYANAHRIQPELAKPAKEQNTYLAPELYGKPRSAAAFRLPVR
jgi:hypothetical protein